MEVLHTRARDQLLAAALRQHLEVQLQGYATVFQWSGIVPERPAIEWPDGRRRRPERTARTLQLLAAAASIRTPEAMPPARLGVTEIDDEVAWTRAGTVELGVERSAVGTRRQTRPHQRDQYLVSTVD